MPEHPDHARGRAHGLSLWLTLEGPARARLRDLIASLAHRLGGAEFEPHLTLIPGLALPEPELARIGAELAASTGALPLLLTRVGGRDEHFRCLYAEAEGGPGLEALFSRACRRLGYFPREPFFPHLSLAYGRLAPAARASLCKELAPLVQSRCEARHLTLVRTEGPPTLWTTLGTWPLGRDPG